MKVVFVLIALLLCFGFVFSDSITSYVVPASVPLNQQVTATGVYADSNGDHPVLLCHFYILDSSANLVYQATDQYSTNTGRFAMTGKIVTEPMLVRGETYTIRSECGTASVDANFVVDQKQDLVNVGGMAIYPQGGALDLKYLADNAWFIVELIAVFGVIILFVVAIAKGLI